MVMAWPYAYPKEDLHEGVEVSGIAHNDMHLKNVMVDGFDYGEHMLAPKLKVIDFGKYTETGGPEKNIYQIGLLMYYLMTGSDELTWNNQRLTARIFGEEAVISTRAVNLAPEKHQYLDTDLRGLVIWCLAAEPDKRPSISRLVHIVGNRMREMTPDKYAGSESGPYETDEAIAYWLQNTMSA
ncbi:hypothetical protein F4804DRAFT_269587 [Jackrogersella minutella]|nr:hypothetical protein F4804DRAFT_269587 [Jackrogersella minutella]